MINCFGNTTKNGSNPVFRFHLTCLLPRSAVAKRLKLIANILILAMHKEMNLIVGSREEIHYLQKYQLMVTERCNHLLSEADGILSIEL